MSDSGILTKTGLVARVIKADGTILPNAGPAQQ